MKPTLALLRSGLLLAAPLAHAADGTWASTTSGATWSTSTNWTGGIIADGAGSTANITSNITANNTQVYVDGSRTIGNIVFSDAGANGSTWLVVGSPITLDAATPTITATTGAWITSNIGGTAGLIKAGALTLTLSGFHTYTGTTTVNGGTLTLDRWGSLGGGNHASDIAISSGATFNYASFANQTLSGVISGAGALTKATGGGTLTISNASNLLSGATTVSGGVLNLTGTLGSSAIAVNAGGTLTGTGSTTGNITFAAGSGILLNAAGAVQGANVSSSVTAPKTYLFVNDAPTGVVVPPLDVIRYTGTTPGTANFNGALYRSGSLTDTGSKITFAYQAEAKTWIATAGGTWDVNGASSPSPWSGGSDSKFFWGDSVTFGGFDPQTVTMVGALAPSSIIVNNSEGTITFAVGAGGALIGNGGLTKSGDGNLDISGGANTYKGATVINGGTLSLRATTNAQLPVYATSSVSVGNTATFEFIPVNTTAINTTFNPPISLADGATLKQSPTVTNAAYYISLNHTLTVAGNTTITGPSINAPASGNFAGLMLDGGVKGSGTLTINGGGAGNGIVFRDFLSSDSKSDFTGNIIVNGVANGNVDAGSGISVRGAQLTLRNANIEVNGTMDLGGNTGDNNSAAQVSAMNWAQGGTGIVTISGLTGTGVVASNNGSSTLILGNNDATASFTGNLVNGNATGAPSLLNLTKIGSGTQILSGASTFSGTTTVNAGILRLNSGNALQNSVFNTASTGTLVFGSEELTNGFTLGGLSGSGNLAMVNSDAAAIDLDIGSTTSTYAGQLSGTGSLTKIGSGTFTLSGTSTYSGSTTVTAGQLNVSGSLPNSDLSLVTGGSLGAEGSAKSITLNGGTLFVDPATPGALTAVNGLSITGPVAVTLSAPPPGPGPIVVLNYSGTFTGNLADFSSTDARAIFTNSAGAISMTLNGATRTWGGTDGTWENGGSGTFWVEGDQKFINGDTAVFPDPVGPKTVTLSGTLQPASTTVTNTTGNDYAFTGSTIAGTGGLTKNGTGTLTISGAHTFTGAVNVNGGTLSSASTTTSTASFLGGVGTSPVHKVVTIAPGATINYDSPTGNSFLNFGGVVATGGYGSFYDINVSGKLSFKTDGVASNHQIIQSTYNLSNGGEMTSTGTYSGSFATLLFGFSGAGGGNINVSGTGNKITAGSIGFFNGAAVTTNAGADLTISSIIKNGNTTVTALNKAGAGTLITTGANSYTGTTAVSAGTLLVNGTKTGTGTVTVATTATLGGSGSIAGATTVQSGGILAPGNTTGNLTFTSTVDLQAGSTYVAEIAGAASNDKLTVGATGTGALTANGTVKVTLVGGYVPATGTVFDLADATIAPASTPTFDFSAAVLPAGLSWNTSSFATNGTISVTGTPADPFNSWATTNSVTGGKGGDDDNDGVKNLLEFATAANPKNGSSGARAYPRVHTIGGQKVLTYTVATRAGATFVANGSKQQADKDNLRYIIEASDQFGTWNSVVVTELAPADASAVQTALGAQLGTLDPAWQWHSFRTDGDVTSDPGDFIRLNVTDIP